MKTLYQNRYLTPASLRASAMLSGMETAPSAHARIMELGCGSAETLIAHARAWPQSVCIGIDIDEQLIAQAGSTIAALELSNVATYAIGLNDLLAVSPGELDYIILHGVFACLGEAEREAVLAWCQQHLAANGIISLRHAVLPGGSEAQQLRDALAFHIQRGDANDSPLVSARAMLGWMALTLPEGSLRQTVLEAEALDDNALTVQWLLEPAPARWYSEFCQQLAGQGLYPLGDALPHASLAIACGESIHQLHSAIASGTSHAIAQQYLDIATGRGERVTLLTTQAERGVPAEPNLARLEDLHWAGNFTRMVTDKGFIANGHLSASGQPLSTENPVMLQILDLLGAAWPLSLSVEQLIFNTRLPEKNDEVREPVLAALTELFLLRPEGLHWSAEPGPYNANSQNTLLVLGDSELTNLWGVGVEVTAGEREYLAGAMTTVDDESWQHFLSLRAKGVLIGSAQAWKVAIQRFLREGTLSRLKPMITTLLLLSVGMKRGGLLADNVGVPELPAPEDDGAIDELYSHVNLLIRQGKSQQAREYTFALLNESPDDLHILRCYSRTCVLTSAWQEALSALCQLMGHFCSSLDIYYDLATALQKTGDRHHAQKIIHGLLRLDSKSAGFWHSLATLHQMQGQAQLAEKCSREAFRHQPNNARYLGTLGVILSDNQKLDEARYFLEKALELKPNDFDCFTSLLFVLTHDHTVTAQQQLEMHKEYGRRVDAWAAGEMLEHYAPVDKNPTRKLRIGFVSGDLRNHPVSNFLLPFWDSFNREHFELVGYNASPTHDWMTDRLQAGAVLWRNVELMSDVELAKQINADAIDILIDLSGHTTYTRIPAFALRPAPVQMTWIGYPGTSGIAAMDYRLLSMGCLNPPGLEKQFLEKVIYVPMDKLFSPEKNSPEISELPALSKGYITFGSFNRPKKINPEVLRLWASILTQYPQSRLHIGFMDDERIRRQITRQLVELGVAEERLSFQGRMPLLEYLASHDRVDILLDTFPYTGGTTTNHAAWMGVPTLTLCGETLACRQGVENMNSYGLHQFIAMDKADFVSKALYWRDHFDELNTIRRGMRNQIPVETENGFSAAGHLEYALRHAWALYCKGQPAQSFVIEESGNAVPLVR